MNTVEFRHGKSPDQRRRVGVKGGENPQMRKGWAGSAGGQGFTYLIATPKHVK